MGLLLQILLRIWWYGSLCCSWVVCCSLIVMDQQPQLQTLTGNNEQSSFSYPQNQYSDWSGASSHSEISHSVDCTLQWPLIIKVWAFQQFPPSIMPTNLGCGTTFKYRNCMAFVLTCLQCRWVGFTASFRTQTRVQHKNMNQMKRMGGNDKDKYWDPWKEQTHIK